MGVGALAKISILYGRLPWNTLWEMKRGRSQDQGWPLNLSGKFFDIHLMFVTQNSLLIPYLWVWKGMHHPDSSFSHFDGLSLCLELCHRKPCCTEGFDAVLLGMCLWRKRRCDPLTSQIYCSHVWKSLGESRACMFSWKLSISASGPGRALSGKNLVRKQGRALGSVSGHLYMTCERPCKCFGDPFEKQNTLIS